MIYSSYASVSIMLYLNNNKHYFKNEKQLFIIFINFQKKLTYFKNAYTFVALLINDK